MTRLVRMWREFRANSSTVHHLGPCVASGDRVFASGVTTDTQRADRGALSYWVAEIILSDDGRMKWYAAFKSSVPDDLQFAADHPTT